MRLKTNQITKQHSGKYNNQSTLVHTRYLADSFKLFAIVGLSCIHDTDFIQFCTTNIYNIKAITKWESVEKSESEKTKQ